MDTLEFSPYVIEQITYYVYLLIDPESKEPFYVGKGTGNRVFSQINATIQNPDPTDKFSNILEIRKHADTVEHIILWHGLSEKKAFEIEAALIDWLGLKELKNIVYGMDSSRGKMNAINIIGKYDAKGILLKIILFVLYILLMSSCTTGDFHTSDGFTETPVMQSLTATPLPTCISTTIPTQSNTQNQPGRLQTQIQQHQQYQ